MKRDKDEAMKLKVDRILKRSVEFAMDNPASSKEYVQELAQEMDERVMEQHIALYVNEYSVDLGEEGRAAVLCLFEKAIELNIFERSQLELILTTNKS
jgi:1,4-dihydroxy-6-naphthoate synthase